jgi:hypothetical protein
LISFVIGIYNSDDFTTHYNLILRNVFRGKKNRMFDMNEHLEASHLCDLSQDYILYYCTGLTKSEMNGVKDLGDFLPSVISILVPLISTPKLTTVNCTVQQESLEMAIFLPGINSQVVGKGCNIKFPTENEEYRKGLNIPEPLLNDMPLGYRLINTCQQLVAKGRERLKYLILKQPTENGKDSVQGPAVGTTEYALSKKTTDYGSDSNDQANSAPNKRLVQLSCVSASWENLKGFKSTPSNDFIDDIDKYFFKGSSIR